MQVRTKTVEARMTPQRPPATAAFLYAYLMLPSINVRAR
jgi:hypothetical protein